MYCILKGTLCSCNSVFTVAGKYSGSFTELHSVYMDYIVQINWTKMFVDYSELRFSCMQWIVL